MVGGGIRVKLREASVEHAGDIVAVGGGGKRVQFAKQRLDFAPSRVGEQRIEFGVALEVVGVGDDRGKSREGWLGGGEGGWRINRTVAGYVWNGCQFGAPVASVQSEPNRRAARCGTEDGDG